MNPFYKDCEQDGEKDGERSNLMVFRKQEDSPEKPLEHLSFWNDDDDDPCETENGYLKVLFIVLVALGACCVCGLAGYYFYTANQSSMEPVIIKAPGIPHKTEEDMPEEEQRFVYKEIEDVTKIKKIAPEKKAPKRAVVDNSPKQVEKSYYMRLGLFDTHYDANLYWNELKVSCYQTLKGCSPIVRIVPSCGSKKYELLAGPLTQKEGVQKSQCLGNNIRLIAVDR